MLVQQRDIATLVLASLVVLAGASTLSGHERSEDSSTAGPSAEAPAEGVEPGGGALLVGPHDAAEPVKGWMERVDEGFGRWVVDPLASFLFYDLRRIVYPANELTGAPIRFIVVWLLIGAIFFTLRMGFINIRAFWHSIRLTKGDYDDAKDPGEVSHFQALASALSATVGLGNIAGVAIAVGRGGPGAVFWLIVAGLLGMSSKFAECSLGQMYRKVAPDGSISGGPMHYLRDGLAELGLRPFGAALSILFSIMCIGGSFGGGCAFQVGQSMGAVAEQFPIFDDDHYPWLYGVVMAGLVGVVIIGGIRRIAATAEKIVPAMCGLYVLGCLYILLAHSNQLGEAIAVIVRGAWTPDAAYGGFLGVLLIGVQRAAFSNEAGAGSASIAHAAAKTNEPISEGIVALLEPFIDTVVVCTITGLVIVVTGVYNEEGLQHLIQGDKGAPLTSAAFSKISWWFPWIVTASVFLFAYSTMISWSYYGERCSTMLLGPRASLPYKLVFLGFVVLGSIVTAGKVLDFSDLMILSMALPNILGVALLSGKIRRALDTYWEKYKTGALEPTRTH